MIETFLLCAVQGAKMNLVHFLPFLALRKPSGGMMPPFEVLKVAILS